MDSTELRLRHAIHRFLHQQIQEQQRMAGAVATFDIPNLSTANTTTDVNPATSTAAVPPFVSTEGDLVYHTATDNETAAAAAAAAAIAAAEEAAAAAAEEAAEAEMEMMRPYYIIGVTILIVFCLITLVFNVIILASAFWIRRPMSPTLSLSVSLAGADAYNSLFLGTGLFVNSLLPYAFDISVEKTALGTCVMLAFEAMRVGGVLVSVAHLLALAINHYLGILRPLHYAATLTPRITSTLIVALWVIPIAFFFVYFVSEEEQGFRSATCNYQFILQLKFRLVFSLLFFIPLILMAVIYFHIYCIVRRTQCSRQRSRLGRHCEDGGRVLVRPNSTEGSVNSSGVSRGTPRSRQLARNWKAVVTTMLILGTYLIGWIPAVLLYLLVCSDCAIEFKDTERKKMFFFYSLVNLLIILKSLSDPIIYAARMQEIKAALDRMKDSMFGGERSMQGVGSGAESTHGYARPRASTVHSGGCCVCCRNNMELDRGIYGSELSRNRMSTYTSSASGGCTATNNVVLFRIKSFHSASINGSGNRTSDTFSTGSHLHRNSTRSQQRRREDVRNRITGI